MNKHTLNCVDPACTGKCMEQTDRISASALINALMDDATDPARPHIGIESIAEYLGRMQTGLEQSPLSDPKTRLEFVTELAHLLNRFSIDTHMQMHDDILASMIASQLYSMASGRIATEMRKIGLDKKNNSEDKND